jgi:hypothetical protein
VNHYLPYFRQWVISHLLSAIYFCRLCSLKVHAESCPFPLLWCTQSTPPSVLRVLFSSLFIIQFCLVWVFLWGSVCPGGYAGLPQGWLWECSMPLICSPVGLHLPSRFGDSVWWCGRPPVFSVLHGVEKLCTGWGLGCRSFASSWWFFLPSVAPASQQEF